MLIFTTQVAFFSGRVKFFKEFCPEASKTMPYDKYNGCCHATYIQLTAMNIAHAPEERISQLNSLANVSNTLNFWHFLLVIMLYVKNDRRTIS